MLVQSEGLAGEEKKNEFRWCDALWLLFHLYSAAGFSLKSVDPHFNSNTTTN